ncbi:hypothetical protein N7454_002114 [Penicillium verhagenii]|nr:hypothetical protein N7454_002114 [Penicillium verhagenii]
MATAGTSLGGQGLIVHLATAATSPEAGMANWVPVCRLTGTKSGVILEAVAIDRQVCFEGGIDCIAGFGGRSPSIAVAVAEARQSG